MTSYDGLPEKFKNLMNTSRNMDTNWDLAHISEVLNIAVKYNTIWSNASYSSPISSKILDIIKIFSTINIDDIGTLENQIQSIFRNQLYRNSFEKSLTAIRLPKHFIDITALDLRVDRRRYRHSMKEILKKFNI
jgi:hypothetical protein